MASTVSSQRIVYTQPVILTVLRRQNETIFNCCSHLCDSFLDRKFPNSLQSLSVITQDQVDKISDDFQSTFCLAAPNTLTNLFYPHEKNTVEAIIREHVPGASEIIFDRGSEIAVDYFLWTILITT